MIVVQAALIPHGNPSAEWKSLGHIEISNDNAGTATRANYNVLLFARGSVKRVVRSAKIRNWPRVARSAFQLVVEAINSVATNRQNVQGGHIGMKLRLFETQPQIYELRLNGGEPEHVVALNPIAAIEEWYRLGYPGQDLQPFDCEFMGLGIVQCFVGDDEIQLMNVTGIAKDGMQLMNVTGIAKDGMQENA